MGVDGDQGGDYCIRFFTLVLNKNRVDLNLCVSKAKINNGNETQISSANATVSRFFNLLSLWTVQ